MSKGTKKLRKLIPVEEAFARWEKNPKFRAVDPYLQDGGKAAPDRENRISQQRMNVVHKESLCINCGCCVSECNAMESSPEFLGPQALAKAMRFVGDPRDGATHARLEKLNGEHGIWECTRCYFCQERCPKGVDPRDAIAKLGAEAVKHGVDRDMGARHARWFVTSAKTTGWLRETELVPKTQGVVSSIKEMNIRAKVRTCSGSSWGGSWYWSNGIELSPSPKDFRHCHFTADPVASHTDRARSLFESRRESAVLTASATSSSGLVMARRRSSSAWSSTGGSSACRATPSSTTIRSSRGRTSIPM